MIPSLPRLSPQRLPDSVHERVAHDCVASEYPPIASQRQGMGDATATQQVKSSMIVEVDAKSLEDRPQIWLSWIPQSEEIRNEFRSLLTDAERARMFRYTQKMDQLRFLTGRAWLRQLLSLRWHMEPLQIKLQTTARGKLFVDADREQLPTVHFNVAHSGELVLIAFHSAVEVGVDIEWLDQDMNWSEVARNVFTPEDYRQWTTMPSEQKSRDWLRRWTLQEAVEKAIGCGMATWPNPSGTTDLRRYELDLPEGYVGAVACVDNR
jgi:4'-phosphopantetheinyl transferase